MEKQQNLPKVVLQAAEKLCKGFISNVSNIGADALNLKILVPNRGRVSFVRRILRVEVNDHIVIAESRVKEICDVQTRAFLFDQRDSRLCQRRQSSGNNFRWSAVVCP